MTSPSSNEPRGFALYVGITEDDAKAAGVSLQHIVTELKTTLNAMVPETHTHAAIALAPKGPVAAIWTLSEWRFMIPLL